MSVSEILEKEAIIEWLPIDEIHFDRQYQRDLSPNKVRLISNNFNEAAAGVLIVNLREDGHYFGMDGQHRHAAMKKVGKVLVQCKVCLGLTIEQEAEIYIACNTVRQNPKALDVFRARLVKHDPIAIAINDVVEKCGLSIQFTFYSGMSHGKRTSPKFIWAVNALEEIYTSGKEKLLEEILILVSRSWPEETEAMKSYVLLGVTTFHKKYKGKYSREEFIAKMNITDFKALARRAQYHAESGGGSAHTALAKALQEAYDKGRKTRRLEPNALKRSIT